MTINYYQPSFLSKEEYKYRNDDLKESRKSYSRFINHMNKDPFIIFMSVDKNPYWLGKKETDNNKDNLSYEELCKIGQDENYRNRGNFMVRLRAHDIGYVMIRGGYTEKNDGRDYEVEEVSFIVYTSEKNKKRLLDFCVKEAKKTLQDSIMLVEKNRAEYLYMDSGRKEYVGMFSFFKLDKYWSLLHKNSNHERYISFQKDVTKASKQVERFTNMINEED